MISARQGACLATAGLLFLAAPSPAELPPDLARAVKDCDAAQLSNDVAALAGLVADDFLLVNSDSSLQDKKSFLGDFQRPGFRIDPLVVEQPMQKVLGDAAIVGGLLHLGWTQDGKHETRLLRIAWVWRKREGRWQATYAQLTRVPQ
jgi:ketosteroid isomerase-like protein